MTWKEGEKETPGHSKTVSVALLGTVEEGNLLFSFLNKIGNCRFSARSCVAIDAPPGEFSFALLKNLKLVKLFCRKPQTFDYERNVLYVGSAKPEARKRDIA